MPVKEYKESTVFTRIPELGNLELLHARYVRQRFSPHFHQGHVIGVIERGELGFDYRGEKLTACQGQINLADPGEVHNGFAMSETGWQYRMFYLGPGQLESILKEISKGWTGMPFFKKGVIRDAALARGIQALHRDFGNPRLSFLEKESRFYTMIVKLVDRHGPDRPKFLVPGKEKKAVKEIREYIQANFASGVALEDLSCVSGLSKYYLLRVFTAQTGLTPHAFLSHVRATRAKQMMDRLHPLADIAQAAGFFDQSHLNRIFKKIFGITPGIYCRAITC